MADDSSMRMLFAVFGDSVAHLVDDFITISVGILLKHLEGWVWRIEDIGNGFCFSIDFGADTSGVLTLNSVTFGIDDVSEEG